MDVFKLISLRRSIEDQSIVPTDDVPDNVVERLLAGLEVNLAKPSAIVIRQLSGLTPQTLTQLQSSLLHKISLKLQAQPQWTLAQLSTITIDHGGTTQNLADLGATQEFINNYRLVTDSWLTLRLRKQDRPLQKSHEALIRAAYIALRLSQSTNSLREAGIIDHLLMARILMPLEWRPAHYRRRKLRDKYIAQLAAMKAPQPNLTAAIKQQREDHQKLEERILLRESILSKANSEYAKWVTKKLQAATPPIRRVASASQPTRPLRAPLSRLLRPAPPRREVRERISLALDAAYFTQLDAKLSSEEKQELGLIFSTPVSRPDQIDDLNSAVDPSNLVVEANNSCVPINIYESDLYNQLPVGPESKPSEPRLSVVPGWGDLIVVRERLVGYDAIEIAHIENVLSGEEKLREHERIKTTEEVTEIETTRQTESERDLQTTNRHELQSESERTIAQDFSIESGVNTSGRYGLTRVETSLEVGFQQNRTESQSSSVELAKEIVARSVERTAETVRELRRLTISESIRELNKHGISNRAREGATTTPPSLSGIYLWVEKIHELELRQYGKRLMVEFFIPEPAISLLEFQQAQLVMPRKPAPLRFGPADITTGNYLCLAQSYGVGNVEPPPPYLMHVGYNWASTPTEENDFYEDTVADPITIPPGYFPLSASASVKVRPQASTGHDKKSEVFIAVGDLVLLDMSETENQTENQTDKPTTYSIPPMPFGYRYQWHTSIPVSILVVNHFDKAAVVHISILCERTPEALAEWKIKTWEKILTAHRALMRDYDQAVAELNYTNTVLFEIQSRPEVLNREIEREELKKWAIKSLRYSPQPPNYHYDFNAVESVGDYQEIDPAQADYQSTFTRFYEEAFEWRYMNYFLYPYFWARRDTWPLRQKAENSDLRHQAFLRAGAARVIVPVTPGYEGRILYYLDPFSLDPNHPIEFDELERINGPKIEELEQVEEIEDTDLELTSFDDLWLELLISRKEDVALGSGTLDVKQGLPTVTINSDSLWEATPDRDRGRELYIAGERYLVASVQDKHHITLDRNYLGNTEPKQRYASGSVPYGEPWLVRLPTSLVILSENRGDLTSIVP